MRLSNVHSAAFFRHVRLIDEGLNSLAVGELFAIHERSPNGLGFFLGSSRKDALGPEHGKIAEKVFVHTEHVRERSCVGAGVLESFFNLPQAFFDLLAVPDVFHEYICFVFKRILSNALEPQQLLF